MRRFGARIRLIDRRDFLIAAALLAVMAIGIVIQLPTLTWMNGYGVTPFQSFNVDDNRFIIASQDFRHYVKGYPAFMTAQLFLISLVAKVVFHARINLTIALRLTSLIWAQVDIVLTYLLGRRLGLTPWAAMAAAFLLSVAPLFVLLAAQGTPDASVLALFYATMLMAMAAHRRGLPWLFYGTCALAGLAMADKFLLPVLVAPFLLAVQRGRSGIVERLLLTGMIILTAFGAGSLFNYTIFNFGTLMSMLAFDNVSVVGGLGPFSQVLLYAWDIPAVAGVVTAILALATAIGWLVRKPLPRIGAVTARGAFLSGRTLLASPLALLVAPLLAHIFLIVFAGVHFTRHLLMLVPVIAIMAASALQYGLEFRSRALQAIGALVVGSLVIGGAYNAYLVAEPYGHDLRIAMIGRLRADPSMHGAQTTSYFTRFPETKAVGVITGRTLVTCDLEYARYLQAADAHRVFHPYGGQRRLDFFHALFEGRTPYRAVADYRRPHRGLEDWLGATGAIPQYDTLYPNRCLIFQRPGAEGPTVAATADAASD